MTCFLNQSLEV